MSKKLILTPWEIYHGYTFLEELAPYPWWHRRARALDHSWREVSVNLKRMYHGKLKWPVWHSTTHGMYQTRFYKIYLWMKSRCNNKTNTHYHRYGERGIQCLWETFEDFKNDMLDSYKDMMIKDSNTTIDRINNNWHYCKENCRWASRQEQSENRSTNVLVPDKYKWNTITELCKRFWINRQTFYWRRHKWYSFEEALHWKSH